MNLNTNEPPNLKGALILADPTLCDSNFARTVIFMTDYRKDRGAHGLILNRPLEYRVGTILKSPEFTPLRDVPVFIGGPVGQEHLTFASFSWNHGEVAMRCATHLSAEEAVVRLNAGDSVRAFLGYSGWGCGQLEAELQQKSWIPRKVHPEIMRTEANESLWLELLKSLGPWGTLVAGMPENPSMN